MRGVAGALVGEDGAGGESSDPGGAVPREEGLGEEGEKGEEQQEEGDNDKKVAAKEASVENGENEGEKEEEQQEEGDNDKKVAAKEASVESGENDKDKDDKGKEESGEVDRLLWLQGGPNPNSFYGKTHGNV